MHCSARAGVLATAALAGLLPSISGCVVRVESEAYTSREEKRFVVHGRPEVTLATFDGPIEVRAWDRPEVLIEVEKTASDKQVAEGIRVLVEQDGDRVRVEARQPDSTEWVFGVMAQSSRRARILATLPRSCQLFARTADGPITVERLSGRIELRSGDGSVRGIDLDGEIAVDTGDGSIRLDAVNGVLDLRSGDGAITAAGKLSAVTASTSDGSIQLKAAPGSSLSRDWELTTGDGTIVLWIPDGFNAELDAQTGDGVVHVDETLGQQAVIATESTSHDEENDEATKRVLRARLGGGGPLVRIRTGDGSVSIKRY